VKDGEFSFYKNGTVVKYSERVDTLFDCDSVAQIFAKRGVELIKSGKQWYNLGGKAEIHSGIASLIDAMNIHNDNDRCISPSQQNKEELIIPSTIKIPYDSTIEFLNKTTLVRCSKKRESLFFSSIRIEFQGITGVDKKQDGSFEKAALKVNKGDKFFLIVKSQLLVIEVLQENEEGITLMLKKQ
jgi:hypothetical protein